MFTISQLAKKAKTTLDTIRFYEKKALLLPKIKAANHYRYYDQDSLYKLNFILNCRSLGLSVKDISYLFKELENPEQECNQVNALIKQHSNQLDDKIQQLILFKKQLGDLENRCENNKKIKGCYIIKTLEKID